jgi:hypothetical protein
VAPSWPAAILETELRINTKTEKRSRRRTEPQLQPQASFYLDLLDSLGERRHEVYRLPSLC